MKQKIA